MDLHNLIPSNQKKIYGFDKDLTNLFQLYKTNNLPNKIFLTGTRGIGKSTLAYHLINFIFSQDEKYNYNSNDFEINDLNNSYKLLNKNIHPNFHLINIGEDKKNIEISQIREMITYLMKSSLNNKERIILIDNVENLNLNSLNALLKVVEEPNDNIFFILVYDNSKKLLNTLKSRCLKFNLSLSFKDSIDITNKILNTEIFNLINNDLIYYYNTPGELINLVNFSYINNVNLKDLNLKNFLLFLINNDYYKKDNFIKNNIYKYIELYFLKLMKISSTNSELNRFYNETIKNIYNMNKFNLDKESFFIQFKEKLLNE